MRLFESFLLAIIFILVFNLNVSAVSDQTIRITPKSSDSDTPIYNDWFIYDLDDGDNTTDRIEVVNLTSYELEVSVYPLDIVSQNGNTVLKKSENKESVSKWITIDPLFRNFTLLPGENVFVPFNIEIPKEVKDAEYAGAVVVEPTSSYLGHNVVYKTRLGVRIYEYNGVDGRLLNYVQKESNIAKDINEDSDIWTTVAGEINRLNRVINFLFVTILLLLVAVVLAVFAPFIEKHKKHDGE